MSKKPKQEPQEEQEVAALMDEEGVEVFEYTDTTFCPVWNETFKRYDMLRIRVNKNNEKCVIDKRESTRYDTQYRALDDVLQKFTNLFVKGEEDGN